MAASKVRPRPTRKLRTADRPAQRGVTWDEIRAECGVYRGGGYRDRFVAVFRRYEGRLTNERDRSNRRVRVTSARFAKEMGIAPQTFRNWLKRHQRLTAWEKRKVDVLTELRWKRNDNAARIREARRMLEEAMKLLSLIE